MLCDMKSLFILGTMTSLKSCQFPLHLIVKRLLDVMNALLVTQVNHGGHISGRWWIWWLVNAISIAVIRILGQMEP